MAKFKVGDVVICVNPNLSLTEGATYTITETCPSPYIAMVCVSGCGKEHFFDYRFAYPKPELLCKGNYTAQQRSVVNKILQMEKKFNDRNTCHV